MSKTDLQISLVAIHEAGHAVVAAYLRLPFRHVIVTDPRSSGCVKASARVSRIPLRAWETYEQWEARWNKCVQSAVARRAEKQSVMILAARAATELHFPELTTEMEYCYASDEKSLLQKAGMLGVSAAAVSAWREARLSRAREIVRIPHVRESILYVAAALDENAGTGRGLSAKDVRDYLRMCQP